METVKAWLQNLLGPFEGLETYDAFAEQAAWKLCEDARNGREIPDVIPEEVIKQLQNQSRNSGNKPEYDIQPKKVKDILNPKTGRKIYRGSVLFYQLVEEGWIDKNGNALKTLEIKKIINPKTGKPVTFGTKCFNQLIKEGWIDANGAILRVKYNGEEISTNSSEFKRLVKSGTFNSNGTKKRK